MCVSLKTAELDIKQVKQAAPADDEGVARPWYQHSRGEHPAAPAAFTCIS